MADVPSHDSEKVAGTGDPGDPGDPWIWNQFYGEIKKVRFLNKIKFLALDM